jgi:hypothetical protein
MPDKPINILTWNKLTDMKKKFQILSNIAEIANQNQYENEVKDTPDYILHEYADMVANETGQEFEGKVVEVLGDNNDKIIYALYIMASDFGDIMYRLIEVTLKNIGTPYPLFIRFLSQDDEVNELFQCNNPMEYKQKLEEYVESNSTGKILGYLDKLVKIREYERKKSA